MSTPYPYQSPVALPQAPAEVPDFEIALAGKLTVGDCFSAWRLDNRWRFFRAVFGTILAISMSILLTAFALSSWRYAAVPSGVLLVAGVVVVPTLYFGPVLWLWHRVHKVAKSGAGIFATTQSSISKAGLVLFANGVPTTSEWSAFRGYRANRNVVLLYFAAANGWIVIARRKLQDASPWNALKTLVQSKLPNL